jgi:hypothetical protein
MNEELELNSLIESNKSSKTNKISINLFPENKDNNGPTSNYNSITKCFRND